MRSDQYNKDEALVLLLKLTESFFGSAMADVHVGVLSVRRFWYQVLNAKEMTLCISHQGPGRLWLPRIPSDCNHRTCRLRLLEPWSRCCSYRARYRTKTRFMLPPGSNNSAFRRAAGAFEQFRSLKVSCRIPRNNEAIAEPLIVSLETVVSNEFSDRVPQRILTKGNHLFQTTFFNSANKAFRIGIQIW